MLRTMACLPILETLKRALIVAHDAGGANLILSWLVDAGDQDLPIVVADGPARQILAQCNARVLEPRELEYQVHRHAVLISGTGWMSDLEHRARLLARRAGIYSIAVLDHWIDYRDRFMRDGVEILPDELWVVDRDAEAVAQHTFPRTTVCLQRNRLLELMCEAAGPLQNSEPNIAFVGEPIRRTWRSDGLEILDVAIMMNHAIQLLRVPPEAEVLIRPHPSQSPEDLEILGNCLGRRNVVSVDSLPQTLRASRWVFGLETYALHVAAEAGRTAVSCLPPQAYECRIPDRRVLRARDMVS